MRWIKITCSQLLLNYYNFKTQPVLLKLNPYNLNTALHQKFWPYSQSKDWFRRRMCGRQINPTSHKNGQQSRVIFKRSFHNLYFPQTGVLEKTIMTNFLWSTCNSPQFDYKVLRLLSGAPLIESPRISFLLSFVSLIFSLPGRDSKVYHLPTDDYWQLTKL